MPGSVRGLLLGYALDACLGDPRRHHPVALFGEAAQAMEHRVYADSRGRGAVYAAVCVGAPVAAATFARRLPSWPVTAAVTWAVLGQRSLGREGRRLAAALDAAAADDGALDDARRVLPALCGRDPSTLDRRGLARAGVESLAENTSDAVVAPLLWGAALGVPGMVGYRAVNTLDAMVGHRNVRHREFGWAAARADDLANLVPARLTALLTCIAAPLVGGRPVPAWRIWRRDGRRHPSPNAGHCEAAAAGALGVRLGGSNVYPSGVEDRPALGDGPPPDADDVRRAVTLSTGVGALTVAAVTAVAAVRSRR